MRCSPGRRRRRRGAGRRLSRALPRLGAAVAGALAANLATLAALALAGGSARTSVFHRALMRRRALALIEARFADPAFGPDAAAAALGLSRRWLSALLADGGGGFSSRLAARRIREASRLLSDPSAADLSVTQIAYGAGFADLSTFYRQFRRRVGAAPKSLR